jgi:hypothetical protein
MTTIHTKVRNGLVTTALAGFVVLVSAPAYGAVAPEPDRPVLGNHQTKAQIEHQETGSVGASTSVPGILGAQTKAQIEQLERAALSQEAAATSGSTAGSSSDDDSSVLVTVLALVAGGVLTGSAGAYTVSRMRTSRPATTRTA